MAGRYYPQKDIDTFDKFNKELVGDLYSGKDGVINQEVVLYKISAYDTEVNMYGETANGKTFIIVQKGDALWNIAFNRLGLGQRYLDIVDLNKEIITNPDLIYPKQLFVIPSQNKD